MDAPLMDVTPSPAESLPTRAFARRVAIAVLVALGLIACAALLVRLADVLLLVFGSVLVATILHAIGDPIARHTPLSRNWALPLSALIIVGLLGGVVWLVGGQFGAQVMGATKALEEALPKVGHAIGVPDLEDLLAEQVKALGGQGWLGQVKTFGAAALNVTTNLVIVLFGGVYLAITPRLYRDGVVMLLPAFAREKTARAFDAAGHALTFWLLGQLFSMVATGVLTGVALWLIGIPSAAGLGLIAGLLEFIPLIGPFLGAVPAVLTAAALGFQPLIWTIVAFLVIQQVESNIIQPIIARRVVDIPPALLLFSVIAFGVLFGLLGVVLAVPLTVVAYVLVKALYVRELLDEPTKVPGEDL